MHKKISRCSPAVLEESKEPCCELSMEEQCREDEGGLQGLRVTPGKQPAKKQGPQSCNLKKHSSDNYMHRLERGLQTPENTALSNIFQTLRSLS